MKLFSKIHLAFLSLFIANTAYADKAIPWQMGMQEAASPVMEKFYSFHNYLLVLIILITIFVLVLLSYVCIKFSKKNNPIPTKTSHNVVLEIIWTLVPVLILLTIVLPSMRILYFSDRVEDADMTLKITGYQWYWGYQYPEYGIEEFRSDLVKDEDLKEGELRLLTVDNKVVLPVNKNIRIQTTGGDVIHNWAVPAFGIKIDAVPGRLNETWVRIKKPGTYYGQCSELCGKGHGFMPIQITAVNEQEFLNWVEQKKQEN